MVVASEVEDLVALYVGLRVAAVAAAAVAAVAAAGSEVEVSAALDVGLQAVAEAGMVVGLEVEASAALDVRLQSVAMAAVLVVDLEGQALAVLHACLRTGCSIFLHTYLGRGVSDSIMESRAAHDADPQVWEGMVQEWAVQILVVLNTHHHVAQELAKREERVSTAVLDDHPQETDGIME